jgi:signal peptidase II
MSKRNGARVKVKRLFVAFVIALNLVLADAVVKECAIHFLKDAPALSVVPGFFNLAYVENRGCAWGMFQGHVWPLAIFGIIALALVAWKRRSIFGDNTNSVSSRLGAVAEPLLYGGIIGNAIDRVFRGFVVDMFDVYLGQSHFPCFNLADSYISVAVALMLLASFVEKKSENKA